MRNDELLSVIMEGKVKRTKARGRQRKMYLDDICTWISWGGRRSCDTFSILILPNNNIFLSLIGDGTLHDTS